MNELYKIYKQHYTPDKMVLSICSAFPYDDILNHCKNNVISKHKSSECIKYSGYEIVQNIMYYSFHILEIVNILFWV